MRLRDLLYLSMLEGNSSRDAGSGCYEYGCGCGCLTLVVAGVVVVVMGAVDALLDPTVQRLLLVAYLVVGVATAIIVLIAKPVMVMKAVNEKPAALLGHKPPPEGLIMLGKCLVAAALSLVLWPIVVLTIASRVWGRDKCKRSTNS